VVTPSDWQKLANALRRVHRTLLERARLEYEREHRAELSSGEFLQLLTTNADFEWLRAMSELIVDLDLVQDAPLLHREALETTVYAAVEHVISAPVMPGPASVFTLHYLPYLHNDPNVARAHAGVKLALDAWPRPPNADTAGLGQDRSRLAERARQLSRRGFGHG
jgi:hypothetical protein